MRAVKNPTKNVLGLFATTFVILVLTMGCSNSGSLNSFDFGGFLSDFAREALVAWLL